MALQGGKEEPQVVGGEGKSSTPRKTGIGNKRPKKKREKYSPGGKGGCVLLGKRGKSENLRSRGGGGKAQGGGGRKMQHSPEKKRNSTDVR